MGSIPLPALQVRTPEQPDVLNSVAKLYQLQNLKREADLAPLRQQAMQQQVQGGQLELQQQQQAMKDQQMFRQAMTDPSLQGKGIGEIADALASKGAISQQSWQAAKKADIDHREQLQKLDTGQLDNAKKSHDMTQELYNNVMNMDDSQIAQNWPQIAQQYDAIPGNNKMPMNPNQPMTKQQLAQFAPVISMGNSYLDQEMARREKNVELKGKQASADFYAQNGGAPGVSAELIQQADWLKKNPGKGPSDYKLWVMKNSPSAMVVGNQLGGQSNSDALDFAANNYRQTGQLPAGFMRSPGTTSAIINRAAQLDQQAGGQGIAANKTILNANKVSLDNLQKNFDNVTAFENTAGKNLDQFLTTAKAVVDSGSPLINSPLRSLSNSAVGSDKMAAFNAARQTALTEIAKVLNSSNASGVLSDSARHEVGELIGPNATLKQVYAAAQILRQDMQNRHDSYQMQINGIQERIKGAGGNQQPQPATAPLKITLPSGKQISIE